MRRVIYIDCRNREDRFVYSRFSNTGHRYASPDVACVYKLLFFHVVRTSVPYQFITGNGGVGMHAWAPPNGLRYPLGV